MKLRDLYERDIDRRIDPVATVSELDVAYVQKEIEEYFFTDTLFKHLYTFLNKLSGGTDGRTGVWINGYYGSGKSHFLKYVYYCLSQEFSDAALDHFEASLSKYEGSPLDQPVKEGEARVVRQDLQKLLIDPVLFNIKTVSDDDRSKRSVTKTFYNRLNAHRGYNKSKIQIARFEKHLDEQGQLEAFRRAFNEETGDDWEESAGEAVDFMLGDVLEIADRVAELDVASTREALQREASVSTEDFVDELERYLEDKPDDYRLVYLVDEVSQYMQGEPNLLVNLQSIVEEIGDRLGDAVWVVCTAQQDLKDIVDTAKQKQQASYSYGKILARFETYLPLESQQADLITKKRVLDKSPEGADTLRKFYGEEETAIRNQFQLGGSDLYQGYNDVEEFVASYPFIPYQFKLVVEVIRAFARADFLVQGVAGTERSLIGLTHEVAKACKTEDVGYFVSFDEFYNARLADKLTHRARSLINKALQIERVKEDVFAQRVVKALFLLSNIARDQSITFPATVDNLAFILIGEVDPAWAELKRKTQDVLDHLVGQNVVSESEGTYRFLQEEEIRVKDEIDNQAINLHDRLETVADELVSDQVKWSSRVDLDGTKVRLHLKVDDYEESSTGTATVHVLLYNDEDPESIAFKSGNDELVLCLHEAFGPEQRSQLDEAVRIRAYLQEFQDSATGERLEAMHMFREQSKRTLEGLRRWFSRAFASASYISGQQVLSAADHNGQSAQAVYESIVDQHLRRLYNKREQAQPYASSRDRMRQVAKQNQGELDERLTEAESEMNNFLTLSQRATMTDVRRKFEKPPYGWKDTEMIHVLLNLEARNKWTFRWNSEDIGRDTFVEKAIRKQEQSSVTIHKQEEIDPGLMHEVTRVINQIIFNKQLVESTSDPKQLAGAVRRALKQQADMAASHASDHRGRPFARHFEALSGALEELDAIRDTTTLFEAVTERADELQTLVDRTHQLTDFWEQHGDTYQDMRALIQQNEVSFDHLNATAASRARKLAQYVETEDLPFKRYRTAYDYYEAVREALDEQVDALRDRAVSAYADAFDALEAKRDELDVDDTLPDRESTLSTIRRADNLATLQNRLNAVSDFRARYLAQLNDAATEDDEDGKTSTIFNVRGEISRHQLETEDDVDDFIRDLREKLMRRVRDDKIVIIK